MNKINVIAKFFLSTLIIVFSVSAFADNWRYSIIVDAGSSGSRLHLLRYQVDSNTSLLQLPVIQEVPVTPNKANIPLATYLENPSVKSTLDSLLDAAIIILKSESINPKDVPVSVFGTAGMRLLSDDKQKTIYASLIEHLKEQHGFTSVAARTITGNEEGIFDWLDVNFLANKFREGGATLGIIDVGGASMEIVFARENVSDKSNAADQTKVLIINGKKYTLYSNSVLGLGLDEIRKAINNEPSVATCYPNNYFPASSNNNNLNYFSIHVCNNLYTKILMSALNEKPIIPIHQPFVAFGGAYFVFQFFSPSQIASALDQKTFENSINTVCKTTWESLKAKYPTNSYLANECANGAYIDELLFGKSGFGLNDSQLQITNTINQHPIDWALGALLYQIINF